MKRWLLGALVLILIVIGVLAWRARAGSLAAGAPPGLAAPAGPGDRTPPIAPGSDGPPAAAAIEAVPPPPTGLVRLTLAQRRAMAARIAAARARRAAAAPPAAPGGGAAAAVDDAVDPMATAQQVLGELQAASDEVRGYVAACVAQHQPGVRGFKAELLLTGDPDVGTLIDAPALVGRDDAPLSPALDDCVRSQLQTLALPPIKTGNGFTVSYDIEL